MWAVLLNRLVVRVFYVTMSVMQQGQGLPAFVDIFLKKNFVVKFFAVLVLAYVGWGAFSYFQTRMSIRDAAQYFHARDYATAYEKIMPHAMNGDPESRFQVGVMTALGLGVAKDKILATMWFACAGASGCQDGQNEYRLAIGCFNEEWGQRSKDECLLWAKISADMDYQPAAVWLDQYNASKNAGQQ